MSPPPPAGEGATQIKPTMPDGNSSLCRGCQGSDWKSKVASMDAVFTARYCEPGEDVKHPTRKLGQRADGLRRGMCLLAHLGSDGVLTHRSAENRAVVGIRRRVVAFGPRSLMDPIDPEPSLGQKSGLSLQGVSTQIAGSVINDQSRASAIEYIFPQARSRPPRSLCFPPKKPT